jgi:hypothetical protein
MNTKLGPAMRRIKNSDTTNTQRTILPTGQSTLKPKSFAENLMNMLAM